MHRLAAKIKAGTVRGNCQTVIDPALPFGGFKQSGIGCRSVLSAESIGPIH